MATNEDLLREIEHLKKENRYLRTQCSSMRKTRRESYNSEKLTRIPEFEGIFWEKNDKGQISFINANWVTCLGSLSRALLFPYLWTNTLNRGSKKYPYSSDLTSDEYLKYTDFMDDLFAMFANAAKEARREASA